MIKIFIFSFFLILTNSTHAEPRIIIHLTDYLANDYSGAVSEQQKILSDGEYAEQIEFSNKALEEGKTDPVLNQNKNLMQNLEQLNRLIKSKAAPSKVVPLAREIQNETIKISGIVLSPSHWPDYSKAAELYNNNCIQCHGEKGYGDGPDGVDLDPRPANFHDVDRAVIVSPFAAFNTIRLGVQGTGMPAFGDFSDEEVWSLALYVNTFRFGTPQKSQPPLFTNITDDELLTKAASLNDIELLKFLEKLTSDPKTLLHDIRLYYPQNSSSVFLDKTTKLLQVAYEQSANGFSADAAKTALRAYFEGIEPIENKLKSTDPDAVTRIEEKMANLRKAFATQAQNLEAVYQEALTEIKVIKDILKEERLTPVFAFFSGFTIILREGFEAVLIILAMLGVARVSKVAIVTTSVHVGWALSLVLGLIGWFASGWLIKISGVGREMMEAITSIFAVFVLIYVGFWMHRQTEISKWKEFINVKVKNLANTRNLIGLFALSFIASFREVLETVLFLRTIAADVEGSSKIYLLMGVCSAFAIVFSISFLISKYSKKISLQKFFNLSSVLMMILSTILAGKGIHSFQEAGMINITAFPLRPRFELLGIYPSWQTISAQVIVLIISIYIWKIARKSSSNV